MTDGAPHEPTPPTEPVDHSMTGRIRRLIFDPKPEWIAIDSELMTERQIITGWVMPLAAIGPASRLIGSLLFGYGSFGYFFRPSIAGAVVLAIVSYVMTVIGTWILAKVIDLLAPAFDGIQDPVPAMKVAAYSSTAAWLAGVFGILPSVAFLSIVGIYSLYLLYVGLPLVMRVPPAKSVGYVIATIVAAVIVFVVIGEISASLTVRMLAPNILGYPGT